MLKSDFAHIYPMFSLFKKRDLSLIEKSVEQISSIEAVNTVSTLEHNLKLTDIDYEVSYDSSIVTSFHEVMNLAIQIEPLLNKTNSVWTLSLVDADYAIKSLPKRSLTFTSKSPLPTKTYLAYYREVYENRLTPLVWFDMSPDSVIIWTDEVDNIALEVERIKLLIEKHLIPGEICIGIGVIGLGIFNFTTNSNSSQQTVFSYMNILHHIPAIRSILDKNPAIAEVNVLMDSEDDDEEVAYFLSFKEGSIEWDEVIKINEQLRLEFPHLKFQIVD
jgi:hypothetical protein